VILSEVVPGTPAEVNIPPAMADVMEKTLLQAMAEAKTLLEREQKKQHVSNDDKEKDLLNFYKKLFQIAETKQVPQKFRARFEEKVQQAWWHLGLDQDRTTQSEVMVQDKVVEIADQTFRELLEEMIYHAIADEVCQHTTESFNHERAKRGMTKHAIWNSQFIKGVQQDIRKAAEHAAITTPAVRPDFIVSVKTDRIKCNGGSTHVVTRFNMVLHEEGLEWLTEKSQDGTAITKLLPE